MNILHAKTVDSDANEMRNNSVLKFPQLLTLEIFRELIVCEPLQRLQDVSFLGAIDKLGPTPAKGAGSRLDHTIGVTYLAYLGTVQVSADERNTAIAAALLHDVGHGPLSHSAEPFFRKQFNVDHRIEGARVIRKNPEIRKVLDKHAVDVSRVENLALGKKVESLSFLFHYPINVDTIEGIIRSANYFGWPIAPREDELVHLLVSPDEKSEKSGDIFWHLKWLVYNWYILHPKLAMYDAICQTSLKFAAVKPSDYKLSDSIFLDKYRSDIALIFEKISKAADENRFSLDKEVGKDRTFDIDKNISVRSAADLRLRYKEKKHEHARQIPSD